MTPTKTCPYCDNKNCEVPTIDNGVGIQQCGQTHCPECKAVEIPGQDYFEPNIEITQREVMTGWYRGDK